ncbi:hypothetical protein IFU37_014950 [Pantoea agglomerans]|uniref:Uncharacterized protein n=1 Tax=Enterobacter agglomerans TaxID=549 RepID=A0ACC5PVY4_ENTAG|nr:hypothetical protein [Pantoea agglomerans]MBD8129156.1 hypothetical protein [Pantoea agglomerans]MBD8154868.1 hypothetical protein [Pantoea agglomerans]MBD8242527.1 hypothetical protein [Pantoea agglomerans]WVL84696.1 hypothetical protein IFU02_019840 [Pantoea agglomerans]WVL88905.1 hypothetical protein IFU37_014950 [Pantoea agglomerans]
MSDSLFEVVTHAENALAFSNQALSMLEVWLEALQRSDENESNRVAAVHTLVHEAMVQLKKATEVNHV